VTGGPLTGMLRPERQAGPAGSSRVHHPMAVPRAADPSANGLDWEDDVRPRAAVSVPDGHLAVKLANGGRTSAGGHHKPGDIVVLPGGEARRMIAEGRAREVRTA
jgi:hypothetical protein